MQTNLEEPRALLQELFQIAVAAANPHQTLSDRLPEDRSQRAVVIGAGKGAAAMARALEDNWQGELSGIVVTRYGHAEPCQHIEVVEAAHPVPDDEGTRVAQRILDAVSGLSADDLVICLLSGGGSALLSLPARSISLADKQSINRQLLHCGAAIDEINCVRKHLSSIKGGRLARACAPARLLTYAISDVPGDIPSVIASGPTVADESTSGQALAIIERYSLDIPDSIRRWLESPASETLKAQDPAFDNSEYHLIATPYDALQAAAQAAQTAGLNVRLLGDSLEGEAREVARMHAAIANDCQRRGEPLAAPCLLLSGGETSVTVRGAGRGGRNAEFLLGLANALGEDSRCYALAADTDGIDGSEDNAGAILTPESLRQARALGLDGQAMLDNNDAYSFFAALDDLLITGPTRTNVNDFRAVLVLP